MRPWAGLPRQPLDDRRGKSQEGEDAHIEQEAQFGQNVSATLFDQIRAGAASMTPEIQSQLEAVSQKLDSFLSMSAQVEQQADQTLTQTAASLEAARLAAEARMQEAQKLYQDAQTAYNEAKSVYDAADLAARTEAEAYLSQLNDGATQTAQDADALIREYLSGDERLAQLKAQYEAAAEHVFNPRLLRTRRHPLRPSFQTGRHVRSYSRTDSRVTAYAS
jgi:transcription termination factor NusB